MQKRSCEKRARAGVCVRWMALAALALVLAAVPPCATAQMNTTTVQGTIYRADGTAASGTVLISWRAFITPQNQAVAAGSLSATIGANGFLSVNLSPNAGALPAGSYYTAVYHLSDGTVNQEYWVVPASGTASVASVRAQLEPSTVAAQPAVTEAYVQSAISSMGGGYLPLSGGTLSGPLTLSGDPVSANQAATKHYADSLSGMGLPMGGGSLTGPLTAPQINGVYTVDGVVYPTVSAAITQALTDAAAAEQNYMNGVVRNLPGAVVDARGIALPSAHALGSFDAMTQCGGTTPHMVCTIPAPGACSISGGAICLHVPLTVYLGPFADYTASGPIVLETGLNILGTATAGPSGPGTVVTSTNGSQPMLTAPQVNGQGVTYNVLSGLMFVCAAGNTNQMGADIDVSGLTQSQYGFSTWTNVGFRNCMGDSIHLAGSSNSFSSAVQIDQFYNVSAMRPIGGGYALYIGGSAGANQFYGGNLNSTPGTGAGPSCDTSGSGTNVYVGANSGGATATATIAQGAVTAATVTNGGLNYLSSPAVIFVGGGGSGAAGTATVAGGIVTGISITSGGSQYTSAPTVLLVGGLGTSNPYSLLFDGLTVNGGGTMVNLNGADGITFRGMHHEGCAGTTNGYLFTLGGSQNQEIVIEDSLFRGGVGTGPGGFLFNTQASGTALSLQVEHTTWVSPSSVVAGVPGNNSQLLEFHDNFAMGAGSSGIVPALAAATALNVSPAAGMPRLVDVFGTAQICSLTGNAMAGESVIVRATGAAGISFATASAGCAGSNLNLSGLGALALSAGETATLAWNDATNTWDLSALGKSANRVLRATTTLSDTGGANDNEFQNFVSSTYGNCWVSRAYAGSGLWSASMSCTNGSPAKLSFYGSPQAAKGGETWSLLAAAQNGLFSVPGNLGVGSGAEVQGAFTGASINGEITVDGTTYPNLNAAWNAAASLANASGQNQTIRLGPGTFPVTATLAEPANGACVSMIGSAGTTMNADSAQVATTLTVPVSLGGDVFYLGNAAQGQGCTFKDLNLLGGGHATHGFEMQWFRGLLLDNVTVNDTSAEGILLGEESSAHQASFLLRNVTVSYSSAAFTPANRPAWSIHLQQTAMDSHLDAIVVRNALTAAIWNEGTGNTGYLIHGFGYPYTCTTAPCANNAASGAAANASYATNYVIYDTGGSGSVWTDTYADSPAIAGFYVGANGVEIHGGHIQWPDLTSFPSANLAQVAASVSNNLLIADVDCLEMASGANWITYAGTAGTPPTFASVHHLTGCGNYYQALEPAVTTGFSSGGANINDPSGAVPRVWATPLSAASNQAAYSAQMYTGYQGDAFQAHFSGVAPFFNVTYQGTIRTNGGIALGTVVNTASTLTLTAANKNVIANAASGPQTITLPSCYTPFADNTGPTGLELTIVKSDPSSNAVTLATTSAELIYSQGAGALTLVLPSPSTQTLVCGPDNNWYVAGSAAAAAAPSGVTSFNGRTGAVVAAANDYSFAQLSGQATNAQLPATLTAPT
ncbi:MAG: hypothetical protein WA294_18460, partial [Acidobacteriaceae bacterium]